MDREKLVRDLINTFNDRNELHIAYKEKMKGIILHAFQCFSEDIENGDLMPLEEWIDNFVEERFKVQK